MNKRIFATALCFCITSCQQVPTPLPETEPLQVPQKEWISFDQLNEVLWAPSTPTPPLKGMILDLNPDLSSGDYERIVSARDKVRSDKLSLLAKGLLGGDFFKQAGALDSLFVQQYLLSKSIKSVSAMVTRFVADENTGSLTPAMLVLSDNLNPVIAEGRVQPSGMTPFTLQKADSTQVKMADTSVLKYRPIRAWKDTSLNKHMVFYWLELETWFEYASPTQAPKIYRLTLSTF